MVVWLLPGSLSWDARPWDPVAMLWGSPGNTNAICWCSDQWVLLRSQPKAIISPQGCEGALNDSSSRLYLTTIIWIIREVLVEICLAGSSQPSELRDKSSKWFLWFYPKFRVVFFFTNTFSKRHGINTIDCSLPNNRTVIRRKLKRCGNCLISATPQTQIPLRSTF